jgi:hypothetical protein
METSANVIAHATQRHRAERHQHHVACAVVTGTGVFAQEKQQFAGAWKLRCVAKTTPPTVKAALELSHGKGQCLVAWTRPAARLASFACSHFGKTLRHLIG